MELKKAIKERRSVRSWQEKDVPLSTVRKIIELGTWAPSACNRQLWRFIIITDNKIKKDLEAAGSQGWVTKAPATIAVFYHQDINSKYHANIQSASAAMQNIILAAYEEGLGCLWMAEIGDYEKIKKILKVPQNFIPIAYIILGYPKHIPPPPKRHAIDDIIGHNAFPGTDFPSSVYPEEWTFKNITDYQEKTCRSSTLGHKYFRYPEKIAKIIENDIVQKIEGDTIDLFAYDGHTSAIIAKNKKTELYECSQEVINFIKAVMEKENVPGENYTFICGGEKIPKKDNSMDTVTIILKLERYPNLFREKIIDECFRILKHKGKLIILYRNNISPGWLNKEYRLRIKKRNKIDTHYLGMWSIGPYYAMRETGINKLLKRFSVIEKKGYFAIPLIRTPLDKIRMLGEYQLVIARKM